MSDFSVNLTGRVALVTGAGHGVGRATALALAHAGAAVCVSDVNPDRVDQVVEAIRAAGGRAVGHTADSSNRFQAAALIEATRDAFGGLNILVNAAGADKRATLLSLDEYDWRRVLDINLSGTFFCTQLAARVMADEGGGVIVNVGSVPAAAPAYAASQTGIAGLTRAAARELAAHGIRINAVQAAHITHEAEPADTATMPQGRAATAADVAAVALFLCSDGAAFMTGQTLVVDGGTHATRRDVVES